MPQQNQFFSKEFMLTLYRELWEADTKTKIQFTLNYIETVKENYPLELVEYMTQTQLANIYFDQQEYEKALPLLKEINEKETPEKTAGKHLYTSLLIRTHRFLKNYKEALSVFEGAMEQQNQNPKAFKILDLLEDYVNLCEDAVWPFDPIYEPHIHQVIQDLGFPEKNLSTIELVRFLEQLNKTWNIRLGTIQVKEDISQEERNKLFQEYIQECPIQWYRDYASRCISPKINPQN
ncbi:tetratricopeptide repeat protein [Algoriphagus hitonicola]|uniref:Tetratricopeptide repeat-containing protein n=1 Tax=Algoriphagus hitonicola TaxID=435880 RepID=A0A1I2VBC9_9BACT|nr:tetratricopeptide repeat protein [Algoriphagus hitonicola]SFG86373.1 Tetratricopeptide repeat-containing protein [Algoriphagus hitonicola]